MKRRLSFATALLLSTPVFADNNPVTDVIVELDGEMRSMNVLSFVPFSNSYISWNYDDDELLAVYLDRGHNAYTQIQYRIDYNSSSYADIGWTTLTTTRTVGVELPVDDNAKYPNFPNMSPGGIIFYRFRNVDNPSLSNPSAWAYINPFDVYYDS